MALPRTGFVQPVELAPGGLPTTPSNRPSFTTGQTIVPVPGVAIQLSAGLPIPTGFSIVLKAKKSNTKLVYIGQTQAAAQAHTTAYILNAQETIRYFIIDGSAVWVDADNANEGIDWTVEQ